MKHIFYLLLCCALLGCSGNGLQKQSDGVILTTDRQPQTRIRLQVVNENIIRVSATPDREFSGRESLMVNKQAGQTPFTLTEDGQTVTLATSRLQAKVNRQTGEVSFTDALGNPLLAENKGGGKSFAPIEVEGDKGYTLRQVFESPTDEAFYGLGQHQSDEFNYKGKNETLFQYNTKVSVPFFVSNKNYGILWDNNSLTRFGDPRDYAQLSVFTLYDKEGEKGALTATYRNARQPQHDLVRREAQIDYENLEKVKNFPQDFNFYGADITWEGEIEPAESGIFRFILYYAGYTKVFIDGREVVAERWRTAWNPNSYKFECDFAQGKRYPIRIEWKPDGGISYLSLKALSPVDPAEQNKLSLWSEMGDMIDYYFVYGANTDEVIRGYRTLTGKSQIMPRWAMGYWQSRERYKTQDELLTAVNEYRRRGIGLDNIVLDWSYWPEDAWGSHEFDLQRFPDAKGMVDSVHALNAQIMISVWPKFYHTTEHYKEFDKNGWMYTLAVKDSIRDWIGRGYIGSFYDAYSAGARKLFWEQMKEHLYSKGIDAWWMDASEPDILSNAGLGYRKQLSGPTALGPSTRYLNAYALMNAEAIYDGQRGTDPDKRVFLLTRSGFGGLQRYSTATWSGDIGTCWEDMKAQIPAGLNFALSGIPYWTMDIGGFCVQKRFEQAREGSPDLDEWREMNARWHQFGAFCPLYRSHGQYPYREIYNIAPAGHPAYESMVWYNELRYRLMPYIYTLAGRTWFDDYTIMRPLVMDFNGDNNIYDISDQYMFGDAFLVCPVYEYKARSREVYLPQQNDWYDFYTGKSYKGGQQLTAAAPYGRLPLFVKAGSIVPFGPDIEWTTQKAADPVTLFVYTGKDGSFTLYEDEGVNYNYEKGRYSRIPFRYNETGKTLTVGEREGSFDGMLSERTFRIVTVSENNPVAYNPDARTATTVKYDGKAQTIKLN